MKLRMRQLYQASWKYPFECLLKCWLVDLIRFHVFNICAAASLEPVFSTLPFEAFCAANKPQSLLSAAQEFAQRPFLLSTWQRRSSGWPGSPQGGARTATETWSTLVYFQMWDQLCVFGWPSHSWLWPYWKPPILHLPDKLAQKTEEQYGPCMQSKKKVLYCMQHAKMPQHAAAICSSVLQP